MEKIVAAAISANGMTFSMQRPYRHHNILNNLPFDGAGCDQGFLTSEGRFVGRLKAKQIALDAGQKFLKRDYDNTTPLTELYSEDLW